MQKTDPKPVHQTSAQAKAQAAEESEQSSQQLADGGSLELDTISILLDSASDEDLYSYEVPRVTPNESIQPIAIDSSSMSDESLSSLNKEHTSDYSQIVDGQSPESPSTISDKLSFQWAT